MARNLSKARTRVRPASGKSASPRQGRKRTVARTTGGSEDTPYHHGALRDALLKAAETVLERDGLAGLTLRAVAREAGVSHAAPTHHFGDLTGLVSELAAIGFRQFNAAMAAAGESSAAARNSGSCRHMYMSPKKRPAVLPSAKLVACGPGEARSRSTAARMRSTQAGSNAWRRQTTPSRS